jgi:maltose alpha-D-glucosyltransferase/alpha-amylase
MLLQTWEQEARRTFIASYDKVASVSGLYESLQEARPLLTLFEIDKALYEVRYELGNRPDWTRIPLQSLLVLTE